MLFIRKYFRISSTLIYIGIVFSGCATHPAVGTGRMEKGETQYGYAIAAENIPFPYLWYRYGINDVSNVGVRVGVPIYGSGIDYSRLLYSRKDRWDVLNVALSVNPNYNMDMTYYKFREREKNGKTILSWFGIRGMYIRKGISGGQSSRIGLLLGGKPGRIGYEIGYFHDFNSMPITSLFDPTWKNDSPENIVRYGDTPHNIKSFYGLPSEYSRLTGISIQVFFTLVSDKKKKIVSSE
ncbi:MAG: hypothetical protein H8E64_07120 [Candidatus Marinimicrobia bacterium]|nr:hypothetical protein [Candidatus Neomarinimicrobiota bacterium]